MDKLYREKEKYVKSRYDITRGNQSYQAGTNKHLFKSIYDFTGIPISKFFDPCPLDPHFNSWDNADALKISYSYFTFVNPSFDLTRLFIVKALKEYRLGKNIAMIVPSWSCESVDFFEIIVEPIAEIS